MRGPVPRGGCSACELVFGSNAVDLFGRRDTDEDLLFAQDASSLGLFVRRWKLRMIAREAALKEVANNKLRRLLAHGRSFD